MNSNQQYSVFVVDDNPLYVQLMLDYFKRNPKLHFKTFANADECLAQLEENPDVVVLDYFLESQYADAGKNSLEVLEKIDEKYPNLPVVVLSGKESLEIAVDSLQHGAYDYVVKNENAFMRLENAIMNIIRGNQLKRIVRDYGSG